MLRPPSMAAAAATTERAAVIKMQPFSRKVIQALQRRVFSSSPTIVALSSGVDSSVAAALLQQQRVDVRAVHMSNWNTQEDDTTLACSSDEDWKAAVKVAQHLSIDIERLRFEADYWTKVFAPYLDDIQRGRMGNPDIGCNRHVKFGALLDYCRNKSARLATGHYARLWHRRGGTTLPPEVEDAFEAMDDRIRQWLMKTSPQELPTVLLAGRDESKDQSYFLSGCDPAVFNDVLFPLGDYYKSQNLDDNMPTVRQLAKDWRLPSAATKESMGICFVGKRRSGFRSFLSDYLPAPTRPVHFIDVETSKVLAASPGPSHASLYTIGQGAKMGGVSEKYFVSDVDVDENQVIVAAGTHHPALYTDTFTLDLLHWPESLTINQSIPIQTRIRHQQPFIDGRLGLEHGIPRIVLDAPVRGVTKGQMAAIYAGPVCLGGGPIRSRGVSYWELGRELPERLHPAGHNDLSVLLVSNS